MCESQNHTRNLENKIELTWKFFETTWSEKNSQVDSNTKIIVATCVGINIKKENFEWKPHVRPILGKNTWDR
jgi:hypothetical protein